MQVLLLMPADGLGTTLGKPLLWGWLILIFDSTLESPGELPQSLMVESHLQSLWIKWLVDTAWVLSCFPFVFKSFPNNDNMQLGLRNTSYVIHAQNFSWEGSTTGCEQPPPPPMTLDDSRLFLWGPGEHNSRAELLHHGIPLVKALGPALLSIPSFTPETFMVSLLWILVLVTSLFIT